MLCDRIRSFEGRSQLYGTQFDWDEQGRMSPLPIENEPEVDACRAVMGLPPLAEAIAAHRKAAARPMNRCQPIASAAVRTMKPGGGASVGSEIRDDADDELCCCAGALHS